MLGAIIGDMVGSLYEFKPIKTKSFRIIDKRMRMTDDSLLTLAVAKTLMDNYPIKYDEESLKKIQKDLTKEFVRTCSICANSTLLSTSSARSRLTAGNLGTSV